MKALLLLLVFLAGCEYEQNGDAFLLDALRTYNDGAPVAGCVVLEGDSNTDFISVGQHFPGAYNVAVKGSTTADVINRIETVKNARPSVVVLMIGTNDFWRSENGGADLAAYYANYASIIKEYLKFCPRVVCVSVLPIQRMAGTWTETANNKLIVLNAAIKQIADDNGAEFVDEWADFYTGGTLNPRLTFDGIHLNDAGKAIHCRNINLVL